VAGLAGHQSITTLASFTSLANLSVSALICAAICSLLLPMG
jgi:hypothetical protein